MTGEYSKNVALIGGGYWGKNLARNFLSLGCLHTICDQNPATLAGYATGYESVRKTQKTEEIWGDESIKAVAIAAPAAAHYELARTALMAGKDVFVEKPLCLVSDEGEELVKLSQRLGRILMVGHLLQYHPYITELRAILSRGDLGRLQYITSNRLNLGKIRREENALWSFAPHDISVILSLVGGQLPENVHCTGEGWLTPDVCDTTLTAMRFRGGVLAHVYVSWLNPFKEQKLTVVGSNGMAVFDDTKPWNEKLILHRQYIKWTDGLTPTAEKSGGQPVVVAESEPLANECRHFLDCCRDRVPARTDGIEGLAVLKTLQMAQKSLERDGEAVTPAMLASSSAGNFFAHPTAVIDPGAAIGDGTKIWHFSHVFAGAEIGTKCNLGQNVVVSSGVTIGKNVKIQNNVSVYAGTVVEDDVFLGPSCVLTNVSNPRSQINRQRLYETTLIRRGATVGANATIVCGTTIGQYAFIAAGSVVTHDVPDYALIVGVPGVQKGWMSRHGHPLDFADGTEAVCPESGYRYRLTRGKSLSDNTVRCEDLDESSPLPSSQATGQAKYREYKRV